MGLTGGIKAAAAGVHGAGETLRGTFNAAIDKSMNEPEHVTARHDAVAARGKNEISTGHRSEQDQQKLGGFGKLRKKHYEGDGVVENESGNENGNGGVEDSVVDGGVNGVPHNRSGGGGGLMGKFRERRGSHSGDTVSSTQLERVDENNRLL